MIINNSVYLVKVLKDDIKWKNGDRYALYVETSNIETAKTLQKVIEAVSEHSTSEFNHPTSRPAK